MGWWSRKLSSVPGGPIVVQDDLSVELLEVRHRRSRAHKAPGTSPEQPTDFLKTLDQHIDIVLVVVNADRGSRRGGDPELAHEWFGTVMTGSHTYPKLVENLCRVVGVDVAVGHGDDATAIVSRRRA